MKKFTTKKAVSKPKAFKNDKFCDIVDMDWLLKGYEFIPPKQLDIAVVSEALVAVLAEQRQYVELTIPPAAQRAYVSSGRLRALERGSRQATICEILSLGDALHIDPREPFSRVLAKLDYPNRLSEVQS